MSKTRVRLAELDRGKLMLWKTIFLVGVALVITGVAMGQELRPEYIDLRPDLEKKEFTDGKHLIKTLPDGRKVSLGFKGGKIVEIFFTNKKGKELKGVLKEGRYDGVLPPEFQRTPLKDKWLPVDFTIGGCSGPVNKVLIDCGTNDAGEHVGIVAIYCGSFTVALSHGEGDKAFTVALP